MARRSPGATAPASAARGSGHYRERHSGSSQLASRLPFSPSSSTSPFPPSSPLRCSPQAQFLTLSLVLLASYNVTSLVRGSHSLFWSLSFRSPFSTPPRDLPSWEGPNAPQPKEIVPVVFYYGQPGDSPCHKGHYVHTSVKQAKKHNHAVYFIGPRECRQFFYALGVSFEEYAEYEEVYEWFIRNIGLPVHIHVRWFILKAFMERHGYARVLHLAPEVLLYANVSQVAAWMFPSSDIALPLRWPSLRPPPPRNQTPSVRVGAHTALMSYRGLVDWCRFLLHFFQLSVFGGNFQEENVALMPAYSDSVILGWYAFPECWQQASAPQCLGEPAINSTIGRRLVQKAVKPRFRVQSLCQPRACHKSTWSSEGLCVWDYGLSVSSKKRSLFRGGRAKPPPTSSAYMFFEAWEGRAQTQPVQFLTLHFGGKDKEVLVSSLVEAGRKTREKAIE